MLSSREEHTHMGRQNLALTVQWPQPARTQAPSPQPDTVPAVSAGLSPSRPGYSSALVWVVV